MMLHEQGGTKAQVVDALKQIPLVRALGTWRCPGELTSSIPR